MSPLGIFLTSLFAIVVLLAPRKKAVLGVIATVCYLTQGQQVVLLGFHFMAIRIVLLVGLIRLVIRGEFRKIVLNEVDRAIIMYGIVVTLVPTLRVGTSEELVYQFGAAYNIFLSYWVFRGLVCNWQETQEVLAGLALLIVPLAMFMIFESLTRRNIFGMELPDTYIREGRLRCTGSFRGPITAGVFGATLIPLFVGIYRSGGQRGVAMAGLFSAAAITYTSNSSGPLMAFVSGVIALFFWRTRKEMQIVRRGIVAILVGLHLVMKVPVWFIFSKMGALTGGDGWYRSYLIDQAIRHFSDWWLIGTSSTGDWMPTHLSDGSADMTDQYVGIGVSGGFAALALFVIVLIRCFRNLGLAMEQVRGQSPKMEILLWCIGCALFAHVVTLFSVTYFDQMHVAWWALLAMISSTTSTIVKTEAAVEIPQSVPEPSLAYSTQQKA